jgi:hypothetical protein
MNVVGWAAASAITAIPANISSGPLVSAKSSRRPDQPDTAKVPNVQAKEMMIAMKLTNSGVTPCTTCNRSGMNRLTVVCAMPPVNSTRSPSPTGERGEKAWLG